MTELEPQKAKHKRDFCGASAYSEQADADDTRRTGGRIGGNAVEGARSPDIPERCWPELSAYRNR